MPAQTCSLARTVAELKRVVTERHDKGWLSQVDGTLTRVEEAVRRHRDCLKDEEGRVVAVDTALNPSPGVARRAEELRNELNDLLEEIRRLRQKAHDLHPSPARMDAATAAGALPVAPEAADLADFGIFCERIEQLLEGFDHFDEKEGRLMQESANLDLGAGD